MKQKRKVKSFNSSKAWLKEIGKASLLIILWWVLCVASIGLQNRSVIAAAWDTKTMNLDYEWVDDDTEVVYSVSFLKNNNEMELSNTEDEVLSNVYRDGDSLYISPKNIVVNPLNASLKMIDHYNNEVWEWVYSHILWWEKNKLSSSNVTIIAWHKNEIQAWNENSTVLWWKENKIVNGGNRAAILLWWEGNGIETSEERVSVIWWWNNHIGAADVTILWWGDNTVNWSNAIVW